jgi:hypothetical protein
MPKPITALMQKEMTRKEFMGTLALGLGSIMGFSSIIRLLTGKSLDRHLSHGLGYGSSPYGGGRDR